MGDRIGNEVDLPRISLAMKAAGRAFLIMFGKQPVSGGCDTVGAHVGDNQPMGSKMCLFWL